MGALTKSVLGVALIMLFSSASFAGEVLDRVVVIVNSRIILESDLQNEIRMQKLMAGTPNAPTVQGDKDAALDRLIDRVLLQQEMKDIDLLAISDPQITARVAEVRKQLKGADKDEGWRKLLAEAGLTEDDVQERIAEEVNTNLFLEAKFRPGLRVNNARIQSYYTEVLLPQLKNKGAAAPPLTQVSSQIEQVLAEQTLNELFTEWIRGLRSQSRIRVVDTTLRPKGVESPSSLTGMNFLPLHISNDQATAPATTAPATQPSPAPTPQLR